MPSKKRDPIRLIREGHSKARLINELEDVWFLVAQKNVIIANLRGLLKEMLEAWEGYEMLAALDIDLQERVEAAIKRGEIQYKDPDNEK